MGVLVEKLQHRTEKFALLQALGNVDQDVLGGYFFRVPDVKIYWLAIGIYSAVLGVSVQDLTVVTLAHELAHAYTHLGKDIDSEAWETQAFARADLRIVEGFAQFYTKAVCAKLAASNTGPIGAFDALLERQPPQYRVHQEWVSDGTRAGEIMRAVLIGSRSKRVVDYAEFIKRLEAAKAQFS